jgi:NAD(P)H dehydrogenase (quinone)
MAQAIADGARSAGAEVALRRVPETVSLDTARKAGFKLEQHAPLATIAELEHFDAIIRGP